jgi:uncharacterized delta-60 repeat protein
VVSRVRPRILLLVAGAAASVVLLAAACGSTGGAAGGNPAGFGARGWVRTDFGGDDVANALAIQADGRIVAAGGKDCNVALARYTRDGRLDRSFGLRGKIVTHLGARPVGCRFLRHGGAEAVAIQADGGIVIGGGVGKKFALARYTSRGRLDQSFGAGGKVVTDVGARMTRGVFEVLGVKAIALQADGKIVAAGAGPGHFALARYTSDGRLDPSFGLGGVVITDVGGDDTANAVAVQPDGKIVVAGWSDRQFALARYLSNGQLDPSFGKGGTVVTHGFGDDFNAVSGIAVDADGKIVAAGFTAPRFPAAVLVRYTSAGELDGSFGRAGVTSPSGAEAWAAVAIQRDGTILVAGEANYLASVTQASHYVYHVALGRYTVRGRPDRTFGHRGAVLTRVRCAPGDDVRHLQVTALATRPNGKLVVAGGCWSRRSKHDFLLVRYKPDGRLDA